MSYERKDTKRLIIEYVVIWIICAAIIFSPFIPGRKSLVIFDDGFNQCYPAMAYIGNFYKSLLTGHPKMFDFNIGFGDDVIGTMWWYGITDVLLIPFCLVSESLLELSYSVSILFRIFLAGLFFMFVSEDKKPNYSRIGGAIAYSFCPFFFQYGLIFLIFVSPMVWIPVIVQGIKTVLNHKRFSKRLYFGVLFLAMEGFYFLFMAIIVFAAYLVLDLVFRSFSAAGVRDAAGCVVRVVLETGLAILSSAVLLIPFVSHFLLSARGSGIKITFKSLLGWGNNINIIGRRVFLPYFDEAVMNGTYYDVFKLPIISTVSVICLFYLFHHCKKLHRMKLVCVAVLSILAIFSDGVSIIMNAFSMQYARYFVFVFFAIAYITSEMLPLLNKYWNMADTVFTLVLGCVSWIVLFITYRNGNVPALILLYEVAPVMIILVMVYRKSLVIITGLLIWGTVLYGYLFNAKFEIGGTGFNGGTYWLMHGARDTIYSSQLAGIDFSEETDFSRYDVRGASANASLMLGVPTTYSYYSVSNGNMLSFLSRYRVSSSIQGNFVYLGLDERQTLESLMSVSKFNNGTNDDYPTDNKFKYPIGAGFSESVSDSATTDLSVLHQQEILNFAVILNDKVADVDDQSSGNMKEKVGESIQVEDITGSVSYGEGISIAEGMLTGDSGSIMQVSFDNTKILEDGQEVYLILLDTHSVSQADIHADNKIIWILGDEKESYLPNYDRYLNITDCYENGLVELCLDVDSSYSFGGVKVVLVNNTKRQQQFDDVIRLSLKDAVITDNRIAGYTDNSEDCYLLYSIPYSEGWRATIDGNETEIYYADHGLMAVYVPEGKHDIILRYCTPGIKFGAVLSILSMIITVAVFLRNKKCYKAKA